MARVYDPALWELEENLDEPESGRRAGDRAFVRQKLLPIRHPRVTPGDLMQRPETTPPGCTLYVNIPLGGKIDAIPMTGIFIPANYQPQPQVDLILYLHGLKYGVCGSVDRIDQYWKLRYFRLREELNASRKNVLLIAPTLDRGSNAGSLTDNHGGFDAYLDKVMAALMRWYGPYRMAGQAPTVGTIILACHSAGGKSMRKLALGSDRYTARIRECWGFDCLYNPHDPEWWTRWAKSHPNAKLYIYYLGSTARNSVSLREKAKSLSLRNVFVPQVKSTSPNHCWVPKTHLQERVRAAPFLLDT